MSLGMKWNKDRRKEFPFLASEFETVQCNTWGFVFGLYILNMQVAVSACREHMALQGMNPTMPMK